AVRGGEAVAKVPVPSFLRDQADDAELVVSWLQDLQADLPVIKIELSHKGLQEAGEASWRARGRELIEHGRRLIRGGTAQSLHQALDAYTRWVEATYLDAHRRPTGWGGAQARQVAFIRRNLPDAPLGDLDARR